MGEKTEKSSALLFSDSLYSKLRLSQLVVPLLGSLYFAIGTIWGLANVEQVLATSTVVASFLGGLVKLAEGAYDRSDEKYDGDMVVRDDGEGGIVYSLELNRDAGEFKNDNSIRFKVTKNPSE